MIFIIIEEKESWEYIFINGIKTHFMISTSGNIKNSHTGKILKQHANTDDYMFLTVKFKKKIYAIRTHIEVAKAFIYNKYNERTVNHMDGCKTNNHVSNLEWCSNGDNVKHAHKNNLWGVSSKNYLSHKEKINKRKNLDKMIYDMYVNGYSVEEISELCNVTNVKIDTIINTEKYSIYTKDDIISVCKLLSTNEKHTDISKKTGVSLRTIRRIVNGKSWVHISSQYKIKHNRQCDKVMNEEIEKMCIENISTCDIIKKLNLPKEKYIYGKINYIRNKLDERSTTI